MLLSSETGDLQQKEGALKKAGWSASQELAGAGGDVWRKKPGVGATLLIRAPWFVLYDVENRRLSLESTGSKKGDLVRFAGAGARRGGRVAQERPRAVCAYSLYK